MLDGIWASGEINNSTVLYTHLVFFGSIQV